MTYRLNIACAAFFVLLGTVVGLAAERGKLTVYKTPWCGCCQAWTDALEAEGYQITINHVDDLAPVRKQAGVADKLAGCHTAILGNYVLEGHVPIGAINKLIEAKPNIRGISVPGMPAGSLGMGYDPNPRYSVYSFSAGEHKSATSFFEVGK